MKLTISRTTQQKGIFRKYTVLCLDVEIDVSSKELAMLEWGNREFYSGAWNWKSDGVGSTISDSVNLGDVVGKQTQWGFFTVRDLETFERNLIEVVKRLKQKLEKIVIEEQRLIEAAKQRKQALADFRPEGPREIDL